MLSKKNVYTIIFSLIFFICLFGFIWSFTVTRDIRKETSSDNSKGQVVTVKNLVLTETKQENIYWELYAQKGSYDSKTGDVILEDTTGNFYGENNEVALSFESKIGTYSEKTKKIILKGDTLVVTKEGYSIQADEIDFQGKGEDINAKGNVVVKRNQDFIATADKADFNGELTFFEISGNTKTCVYSKDAIKTQQLSKQAGEQ